MSAITKSVAKEGMLAITPYQSDAFLTSPKPSSQFMFIVLVNEPSQSIWVTIAKYKIGKLEQ